MGRWECVNDAMQCNASAATLNAAAAMCVWCVDGGARNKLSLSRHNALDRGCTLILSPFRFQLSLSTRGKEEEKDGIRKGTEKKHSTCTH